MKRKPIEELSSILRRKRAALLQEAKIMSVDGEAIAAERESELEESAQNERIAGVIAHLKERDQKTLREVDEALERIQAGIYGECALCGADIGIGRLRALPTTTLCIECATAKEKRQQWLNNADSAALNDLLNRAALDDDIDTAEREG